MSVEYSPIRVSTIKPQKELTFNLHIRFKEQFLLYLKVGEAVDRDKLKNEINKIIVYFKDKNIKNHELENLLNLNENINFFVLYMVPTTLVLGIHRL